MRIVRIFFSSLFLVCAVLSMHAQSNCPQPTVFLPDGSTSLNFGCDEVGPRKLIKTDPVGLPSAYLITNTDDEIVHIQYGGFFNFESINLPSGSYRIYSFTFIGSVLAQVGDVATEVELGSLCYNLSDNFISLNLEAPSAGTVQTEDGETMVIVCPGDGNADLIQFDSVDVVADANYAYVITDAENNILNILTDTDEADFDGAEEGTCRVWGLAYFGNLTAQTGDNAATTALSDECFDLSDNFITVVRQVPEGGTVSTDDGSTTVYTCPGDGNEDVVTFLSENVSSTAYVYVVTDENNIILDVAMDNTVDFDGAPEGICRVWGLAYTGELTAMLDDDAAAVALSDDCFDLSDNFVTIIRDTPNGGMVSFENSTTTAYTCPGDGNPDVLRFDSTQTGSAPYAYIITDEDNTILDILLDSDQADFDGAPAGTCRVWGLSYTGTVIAQAGDNAAEVALSDDCYELSANFMEVVRQQPEGGVVQTTDGETTVYTCPGDGVSDAVVMENADATTGPYLYLITDEDNNLLNIASSNSLDFEGADPGQICRIWGLAFTGNLTITVGENAAEVPLTDDCYDLSDNFVTVVRDMPEGGNVRTENDEILVYTCPGDGNADIIKMDSMGTSIVQYVYVITDGDNTILNISASDAIDVEGADVGTCRIWGLAYTGNLTAQVGDNAGEAELSDDCFDLSDDFVTVIRDIPDAGQITTADGETEVNICPEDDMEDLLFYSGENLSNAPFLYVITDEQNTILAVTEADSFDFSNATVGTCRIWGLSYTGNLIAAIGDDAGAVDLTDDCYDLSSNFITVIREVPEGGTVFLANGLTETTICPGDGVADVLEFDADGTSDTDYLYLITDENNNILTTADGNTQDFEGAGVGICRVWGLAYTGSYTGMMGDNAAEVALSDDCYDLSDNFIVVTRDSAEAGEITSQFGNDVVICAGDGTADVIEFMVSGASSLDYGYLVTDTNGFLVSPLLQDTFDFENIQGGDYRIYGVSYLNGISALPGDNIFEVPLSAGCFDLTETFIALTAKMVDGGLLFSDFSADTIYLCPNDMVPDIVTFSNSSAATDASYAYAYTFVDGTILTVSTENQIDFDEPFGAQFNVYGISYTGELSVNFGDNIHTSALSDECYDVSENYVTILRDQPAAGEVLSSEGADPVVVCPGAGNEVITFVPSEMSNAGSAVILTDNNDLIVDWALGNSYDFNLDMAAGFRVYYLSYTGMLNLQQGLSINADLATSCYELSSNFVEVFVNNPIDGGTLSTAMGMESFFFCTSDTTANLVAIQTNSQDTTYKIVLTDGDGNILQSDVITDVIDFNAADPGDYRIYGVAYSGMYTAQFDDNITTAALSTNCYTTSDNYISVTIGEVEGGMVSTTDGAGMITIQDVNTAEDVEMAASGAAGANYVYVMTTPDLEVLEVSENAVITFENPDLAEYWIWGLAYTGTLQMVTGELANEATFSDVCFDLSDNFVQVVVEDMLQTRSGTTGDDEAFGTATAAVSTLNVEVYPNPVQEALQVVLDLPADEKVQLQVVNLLGQSIHQMEFEAAAGTQQLTLPVDRFETGWYILQVRQGDQRQQLKFNKL